MQKITVSSNEAGQRLDKLLGKYLSNAPMSFVYKMLRKKNIKLNGKKAQGNEKLTKGDQVEVFLSDDTWQKFAGAPGAEKQLPADLARAMESSIRLSVIYEDPNILILNKPSGMLSQKAAPSDLSLNEYMIGKLTGCKDKDALCFTTDELQKVLDDRAAEKKAALEKSLSSSSKIPKTEDSSRKKGSSTAKAAATVTPAAEDNATVTTSGGEGSADQSTDGNDEYQSGDQDADQDGDFDAEDGSAGDTSNNNDASGNDDNTDGDNAEDDTSDSKTCNITILCDTILNNMDNLTAGKEAYVPSNGVILDTSTVEFTEGETVFDVLKRVCEYTGIQLEYSWTPMYDSYYIEGINNLYEFDCGNESGWMYKVNGWFPNYGCSKYMLEDGDTIVWCYTCNGLGADVGDVWNG